MASISIFLYYFLGYVAPIAIMYPVRYFFYFAAYINVTLAVFNLIPIPPLDGSKILAVVLPNKLYIKYMMYERYVMIGLMILLFTGVLDGVIYFFARAMMYVISYIPLLIFGGGAYIG